MNDLDRGRESPRMGQGRERADGAEASELQERREQPQVHAVLAGQVRAAAGLGRAGIRSLASAPKPIASATR